ncbi:hypothetical protein [Halolamina litorea]|uniref:DUF4352 domain-containing protein n=1 Tax=Halolamina litorea TaxID=1515593 RepID=A0ABD6BNE7_9EURY|nr:hypothetical protein [Halolamina litorea]
MQRRQFLPLAAVALAGCVGPSDGSGPRNPPTTPEGGEPAGGGGGGRDLRIVDAVPREGDDGSLVFVITVENTVGATRSDVLVGRATVNADSGETEYEARREVSLDGDAEAEFELVFDVPYEEWAGQGSLSYGWEGEI